jgi:pilus assembly protein CpaE
MSDALPTAAVTGQHDVFVSVIDPDEVVRDVLAEHVRALDDGVTAFENLGAFIDAAETARPGVVVFGPSEAADDVISQVAGLLAFRQGYGVIMVVDEVTAAVLQQAMRAGVDDVVAVSAEDDQLLEAIARSSARVVTRLPVMPAPQAPAVTPTSPGKVITVFCTKGGTGKSVLAVNLAVSLAKRTIQPVVLVDADLQFGDVALMLQLQPAHTIVEAVQAGERLDGALLEGLLLRHPASGLLVLAAPTEPSSADQIGRPDLVRILSILRERCAYVVVDTSANFSDVTLSALESSDDILVMAGLDVMSLKSSRIGLQSMRVLGIPFSRVKFVLNRANTRVGLTEADAERALQLKVDAALPSDIVVAESVNRGVPVVTSAPRSKFAKCVEALAESLSVPASEPAQSRQTV